MMDELLILRRLVMVREVSVVRNIRINSCPAHSQPVATEAREVSTMVTPAARPSDGDGEVVWGDHDGGEDNLGHRYHPAGVGRWGDSSPGSGCREWVTWWPGCARNVTAAWSSSSSQCWRPWCCTCWAPCWRWCSSPPGAWWGAGWGC